MFVRPTNNCRVVWGSSSILWCILRAMGLIFGTVVVQQAMAFAPADSPNQRHYRHQGFRASNGPPTTIISSLTSGHRVGRITTLCRYSNSNENLAGEDPELELVAESAWTMTEDWALVDGVRAFTVMGSPASSADDQHHHQQQHYTFWDRIVRMNPLLRGRSAKAAHGRYLKLVQQQQQADNSEEDNDATSPTMLLPEAYGPSPILLHDWWIQVEGQVVSMGGTLDAEGGRSVWFPVNSLGHFDGHALDVLAPAGGPPCLSSQAVPGGYCIAAMGGVVYELGRPRVFTTTTEQRVMEAIAGTKGRATQQAVFHQTATSSLAALAAASLLSVAVGFGAGLSLSSSSVTTPAERHHPAVNPTTARVYPTRSEMRAKTSQSISEMRARQEVRVLQEKRLMQTIGGRLGGDEARLKELQQLEERAAMMQNGNSNLLPQSQ